MNLGFDNILFKYSNLSILFTVFIIHTCTRIIIFDKINFEKIIHSPSIFGMGSIGVGGLVSQVLDYIAFHWVGH